MSSMLGCSRCTPEQPGVDTATGHRSCLPLHARIASYLSKCQAGAVKLCVLLSCTCAECQAGTVRFDRDGRVHSLDAAAQAVFGLAPTHAWLLTESASPPPLFLRDLFWDPSTQGQDGEPKTLYTLCVHFFSVGQRRALSVHWQCTRFAGLQAASHLLEPEPSVQMGSRIPFSVFGFFVFACLLVCRAALHLLGHEPRTLWGRQQGGQRVYLQAQLTGEEGQGDIHGLCEASVQVLLQ